MKRIGFLLLAGIFLLPGCGSLAGLGQGTSLGSGWHLEGDTVIGQTFLSRHAGLAGIDLFLSPQKPGAGDITLSLSRIGRPQDRSVQTRLPVHRVSHPGLYHFPFGPLPDSGHQDFFLTIKIRGEGGVRLGTAPGAAYPEGAAYQNGLAQDAQLTFQPRYHPFRLARGLAREALQWFSLLAVAFFIIVLPGWVLVTGLWPPSRALPWEVKLGLAVGAGLAFYPLLFLGTGLSGWHWGPGYAWVPPLSALALLLWRQRKRKLSDLRPFRPTWTRSPDFWPVLSLVTAAFLVFFVRFYVVRNLSVPLWGDSVQHALISQLLVDHNGLFQSWTPYADLLSFTYHFGFHSAAANLQWISGLSAPEATLWAGQILNGLAVLALVPLAYKFSGNRWTAVGTLVTAGLLLPVPMVFVNWGRYTQLAGLAILPAAAFFFMAVLEEKAPSRRLYFLNWIVIAGLALTHYKVLIFALAFMGVYGAGRAIQTRGTRPLGRALLVSAGALLLCLPWFIRSFSGELPRIFSRQITAPARQMAPLMAGYNDFGDLTLYLPLAGWVLLLAAWIWGFWKRKPGFLLLAFWWVLLFLAANPHWLHLPGLGIVNNFAVLISLFIPAGIIIGTACGALLHYTQAAKIKALFPIALIALAALTLYGTRQRFYDIKEADQALVTRPDLRAFAWIKQNTPAESRFLVNSFLAFNHSILVGSDAGWWIPLLAGRQTMLPPINYFSERGPVPDYKKQVRELREVLDRKGLTQPEVLALLKARHITHLYIGQKRGRVNYNGPVLDPDLLKGDPRFRPLYHQDRVWIFELI